ncbi:MAG TPA: SDR family NAD(P)-dependent oxidoreductase [Candidatus Angelobacter sp.]|jgi:NAD(P)-dependent dehydrogenase (short-subunit alcohol dehydrogenase family)
MNGRFAGKTALVTGGTGGLGRSVTLSFLHEGASVIATYIKKDEADALRDAVGPNAHLELLPLDATDENACRTLVDGTVARYGRLDILVNTIGGYTGGQAVWETDLKTYQLMLALNLHAGYNLARTVVPAMLRQKSGAIVNIAAKAAFDHAAGAAAYAASKSAALALFDCLAQDVKGKGVRVNSVLPSIIDTEANRKAMPDADFTKWPRPEEIAKVILFLCSDEARVVHGAAVSVYGES